MSDLPVTPIPLVTSPRRGRRRNLAWVVVVFLIVGGGIGWYLVRPSSPEPPAMALGDGADPAVVVAVEKARHKLLEDLKSAANWGELGMVFGAHGFDPEADRCFAEAERLNPVEPRWPYLRGLAASVHDPARAAPLLKRAIELKPKDPEALLTAQLQLAEVLLEHHQLDEAEALFREGVAKAPGNPRGQFGLAQVALTRGNRKVARDALTSLTDNPFTRKRAAILLAALTKEEGNATLVERYEAAARQLPEDPPWPDPYLRQLRMREVGRQGILRESQALATSGQLQQAADLLLPLIEDDPNPRVLVSAGITLGKLRQYTQAKALFRECLRRDPSHSQAHYFLAVMLFEEAEQSAPENARLLIRESAEAAANAVAIKPDHGMAWLYLGRARLALGDPRGAIKALELGVACRPEFADPHLYLAEALALDGQVDEAIRHARDAQSIARPDDQRPRQLLDRIESKTGPNQKSDQFPSRGVKWARDFEWVLMSEKRQRGGVDQINLVNTTLQRACQARRLHFIAPDKLTEIYQSLPST